MHLGQCLLQKHDPELPCLLIGLAKHRQAVFLSGNKIVDNNFLHDPINPQVHLVESFLVLCLSSEDPLDDFWELGKGGECGEEVAVALVAGNHVAGLYLLIEEDWFLVPDQLGDPPPLDVALELSDAGVGGREGLVCELLVVLLHLGLELGESQLRLHLGDAHLLVVLHQVVHVLEGVVVPVGLGGSPVLVFVELLHLVLVLGLLTVTTKRHFWI